MLFAILYTLLAFEAYFYYAVQLLVLIFPSIR